MGKLMHGRNSGIFDVTSLNKMARSSKDVFLGIVTAIILIGVSYTILAPVIGIFAVSLMSVDDMFSPTVFLIPENPSLMNLRNAVIHLGYLDMLRRAFFYAFGMGLLHVLVASFVGYGFARYRFWGNRFLLGMVILTLLVPAQSYVVPLFLTFRFFGPTNVNLIGSYATMLILTATGVGLRSGLFIYIFRQFFKGMPTELSEAALIDGAGPMRTYAVVMMPNAKPAIVTVMLLAMVWHYGDMFYSELLLPGIRLMHIALGGVMGSYMGVFGNFGAYSRAQMVLFGGITLVIAPIMIIYAILQRQFIEGIERSGIVG